MKFLVVLAALLSGLAFAGDRKLADELGNFGVLTDRPCTLEIVSPEVRDQLKQAVLHIEGKTYRACYLEQEGFVRIVDEEGDFYGPFPSEVFKPVE